MAEQLTSNEVVELVLANGDTLVLSTTGWNLSGLSLAQTKNYEVVTGRGFQRVYESDDSSDWALSFQVGHTAETDVLYDQCGQENTIRRYPFGKVSGADFESGKVIVEYAEMARQGRKLMIGYNAMAVEPLSIGVVS